MRTFQTDNRIFIIGIITVGQCSLGLFWSFHFDIIQVNTFLLNYVLFLSLIVDMLVVQTAAYFNS